MYSRACCFGAAVLALVSPGAAPCAANLEQNAASTYPSRPVRIISDSPRCTADITARFIGHNLMTEVRTHS